MKKLFLVLSMIVMFLFGACATSTVGAEQNNPIKIWPQNENGTYETLYIIDEDTGVNYIVVSGEMYSKSRGIAITPRLNADGSLYVS